MSKQILYTEYGLHNSLWRKIRLNHSGMVEINLKDRNNNILGLCVINRYAARIWIESHINFKDISFKSLIEDSKSIQSGILDGTKIPIGVSSY